MEHLIRISVPIPRDKDGYVDRECPKCEGIFKVMPGTGIADATECMCPYCGHKEPYDNFRTEAQLEYLKSVALNKFSEVLLSELKATAAELNRSSPQGFIRMTWKAEGQPIPVAIYRSPALETKVTCANCGLKYVIYGIFAYCPVCGNHNSLQMLGMNLEIAQKQLLHSRTVDPELERQLVEDALENVVAAFDGFGREACRRAAPKATNPSRAAGVHFQNLDGARKNVIDLFGIDLAAGCSGDDWAFARRCFKKRHLLVHTMGVIDQEYVDTAGDPEAVVGRRITVTPREVERLLSIVKALGEHLANNLK